MHTTMPRCMIYPPLAPPPRASRARINAPLTGRQVIHFSPMEMSRIYLDPSRFTEIKHSHLIAVVYAGVSWGFPNRSGHLITALHPGIARGFLNKSGHLIRTLCIGVAWGFLHRSGHHPTALYKAIAGDSGIDLATLSEHCIQV